MDLSWSPGGTLAEINILEPKFYRPYFTFFGIFRLGERLFSAKASKSRP